MTIGKHHVPTLEVTRRKPLPVRAVSLEITPEVRIVGREFVGVGPQLKHENRLV